MPTSTGAPLNLSMFATNEHNWGDAMDANIQNINDAIGALQTSGGSVSSVAGKTGVVTLVEGDIANLTSDLASLSASIPTLTSQLTNDSGFLTSPTAPASPLTSIQFNNGGSFGGSSQLLWNQSGGQVGTGDHSLLITSAGGSTAEFTAKDPVFGACEIKLLNTGNGACLVSLNQNGAGKEGFVLYRHGAGPTFGIYDDIFGNDAFNIASGICSVNNGLQITAGNLYFGVDNTRDIGIAPTTQRPRTGYFGTSVLAPLFNASTGFQVGGLAPSGNVLRGNGTNFITAQLDFGDLSGMAVKPSVGLVADSNISLTGVQTIDSVLGSAGVTLVLATAQSTGSQNGPWIMQSGAWTRPSWYPSAGTSQAFQFITTFVRLGANYSGTVWRMTTAGAITIDTTATTWLETPLALTTASLSGLMPLSRGGTNADLSATGGASRVLKQLSSGAAVTVAQLGFSEISGTLSIGQLPAGIIPAGSTGAIQYNNSGAFAGSAATADASGNLTALSFNSSGSNGGITGIEGTGASLVASAGVDLLWPDSTAHRWKMNNNNGVADVLIGAATTDTLTNKTLTTPTIGSFTNAQHNHQNAAGGGTLTGQSMASCSAGYMIPSGFIGTYSNSTAGLVATQNEMVGVRFLCPITITATKITYSPKTSAGASTHVGFAIYSSDGTTRITTTGAQDGTLAVTTTVTVSSFTLIAGTAYILAWNTDAAAPGTWAAQALSLPFSTVASLMNTSSTTNILKGATAGSAGAPPTSLGVLSAKATNPPAAIPVVFIEP